MNVAVIAAKFPYGPRESYLATELNGLAAVAEIVVAPVSPDRTAQRRACTAAIVDRPLLGAATLRAAAKEALRSPLRTVRTLVAALADPRTPLRVTLKNAAVIPYAFALAGDLRRRNVDHIHAYWYSTPATVAFVIHRLTGIPFSATAHRWDIYEGNLTRRKAAAATAIRAISHRGARDLRERIAPADRHKVRVVRVGVTLDARTAPATLRRDALRVVCAANLVPVKGHATLIAAVARARAAGADVNLTLAGDGPERPALEQLAARLAVAGYVHFLGAVPHDALLASMAHGDYDAAVLASIERPGGLMEGVPVALIEAMALGLPAIGTTSGSIPELLRGGHGRLVPHGDVAALAAALVDLARDPMGRATLGAHGRDHVRRIFNVATTSKRLAALVGRKSHLFVPYDATIRGTVQAPNVR